MAQAARAIIFNGNQMLVMYRNKHGREYYTLVGGRIDEGETPQSALVREVKEETGLDVIKAQLVFTETHSAPYNSQYIFLCEVASAEGAAIQETSEEGFLNRMGGNIHQPYWTETAKFAQLPFHTMQLQQAIVDALKNGFPQEPREIS